MSYYTQLRPQCEAATIQVTNEEEAAPSTAPIPQSSSWSYRSSQWARSVWYRFAYRQLHDDETQTITSSSSRPVQMYALNTRQGDFVVDDEDLEAESDKKSKDGMLSEDTLHFTEHHKRGQDNNDLDSIRLSIRKSSLLLDADTPPSQTEPWYRRSIGLIYMILANVMFSAMGLTIKALSKSSERIPVLELVAIRGFLGFLLCLGLMWREGVKEYFGPPETRKLLLIRGLTGFTSLTFNLYALNALSLGDATVLGFLAPTFTGLLGKIVLKEAWEVVDALAGGFSLVGVMFIARPSFLFGPQKLTVSDPSLLPSDMLIPGTIDFESKLRVSTSLLSNITSTLNGTAPPAVAITQNGLSEEMYHLSGIFAGILGAMFVAAALISIRKLSGRVHFLHVLSYFHWVAVPSSLLITPILPHWIEPLPWIFPTQFTTWALILTIIATGFLGQMLLSWALQKEKAAKAASMNYAQIVFAFLGEWLCWGLVPSGMSLFGSFIVIFCMVTVTLYKLKKTA